jgi:hypothetical protein
MFLQPYALQADSNCFCMGGLVSFRLTLPAPRPCLTVGRLHVYLCQTVTLRAGSHPRLPDTWTSPSKKLNLIMRVFADHKPGQGLDLTEDVRLPIEGGVATPSTPKDSDTCVTVDHTLVCEVTFVDSIGRKAVFKISRPVFLASVSLERERERVAYIHTPTYAPPNLGTQCMAAAQAARLPTYAPDAPQVSFCMPECACKQAPPPKWRKTGPGESRVVCEERQRKC